MITHRMPQGSPEWHAARLGIPTASQFHKILTPAGKLSSQADGYMNQLIAERILGLSLDTESVDWMARGKALEAEAVAFYELERDCDTEAVGLVITDDGRAGCSPDRMIGAVGGLEIKCPSAAVHVGYLRGTEATKYRLQIQGALWITGRLWWDFLGYCPEFPPALVRYDRDEKFIAMLADEVTRFCDVLDAEHQRVAGIVGERGAA